MTLKHYYKFPIEQRPPEDALGDLEGAALGVIGIFALAMLFIGIYIWTLMCCAGSWLLRKLGVNR